MKRKVKLAVVPLALMKRIRKQLFAMNTSSAHAASWVYPRSRATTRLVRAIDKALAPKPIEVTVSRKKPARTKPRLSSKLSGGLRQPAKAAWEDQIDESY